MRTFIDSNVFIYSFLNQGVEKKQVAARLLAQAIRDGNGYISLQVVKEFCNVLAMKSNRPMSEISGTLDIFNRFNLVTGSIASVRRALEIKGQYGIQFYDALMLAAAEVGGCGEILTEDLNDGQLYCGIKAVNPFKR